MADPTPTGDGQWLYFSAWDSRCSTSAYCLYRSRIDGTNPELLGTSAMASGELHPSPSPDGSRIAYQLENNGLIQVFNVATQQASALVGGTKPAWSPSGSRVAFIGQGSSLYSVKADGTGIALMATASPRSFNGSITWSPDEKYLIAGVGGLGLALVDAQSGVTIPISMGQPLVGASIR